jgi:predicted permease
LKENSRIALEQQASAVVPMYCLMLLGFYAARALHLDSAQYKGLEIFLGKYVMPAVNFYMLARSDMYAVCRWQLY